VSAAGPLVPDPATLITTVAQIECPDVPAYHDYCDLWDDLALHDDRPVLVIGDENASQWPASADYDVIILPEIGLQDVRFTLDRFERDLLPKDAIVIAVGLNNAISDHAHRRRLDCIIDDFRHLTSDERVYFAALPEFSDCTPAEGEVITCINKSARARFGRRFINTSPRLADDLMLGDDSRLRYGPRTGQGMFNSVASFLSQILSPPNIN